jgi:SAM-dependent methyltransferase
VAEPAPGGTVPWTPRTYDLLAESYARANPDIRPGLVPLAEAVRDRLGERDLLLDVGCGAGRDLGWFAAAGVRCAGLDPSAGMLAQARRRLAVPLVRADARRLPVRSGTVAACWCVATVVHLPRAELGPVLAELRRVLRPAGLLVLGVQRGSGSAVELDPYEGRYERLMTRYQPGDLLAELAAAGLAGRLQPVDRATVGDWVLATATPR